MKLKDFLKGVGNNLEGHLKIQSVDRAGEDKVYYDGRGETATYTENKDKIQEILDREITYIYPTMFGSDPAICIEIEEN